MRVIVVNKPRMDDKQIAHAFAGNAASPWYLALVQMINDRREAHLGDGAAAVMKNNELAMAGLLSTWQSLTELLDELDGYVNSARND